MRRSALHVATASAAGQELAAAVRLLGERAGLDVEVVTTPAQTVVFRAVVAADVVILDATIEAEGGTCYPAFTAQALTHAHVVVVSRSALPLNFYGSREGGAPAYPGRLDNDVLVEFVERQLDDILSRPPRSRLERTAAGSLVTMVRSLKQAAPRTPSVFVSYRREAVEPARELASRLAAGDPALGGDEPTGVVMLEPGELAFENEILTARLRWHVVSLLEERLRACHTLWICQSPHYLGSWWTQIELLLVAYFEAVGGNRKPVRCYDPNTGAVDGADDLVPRLTYEQRRRLDRLLSNSGRTMGAETVRRSGELGTLPGLRRTAFFNDEIFTPEFGSVPLLAVDAPQVAVAHVAPDPAALLAGDDERLRPVPLDLLATVANEGEAAFGDDVIRNQDPPRWLWYATRMGRATAPAGSLDASLEALPVLRVWPEAAPV